MNGELKLCPGDIVCTHNKNLFGSAIRGVERIWSKDDVAEYNHVLIIIGEKGETFEALNTVTRGNISNYYGEKIVVFRHDHMSTARFNKGFKTVKSLEGSIYPAWRLFLALIPFLAKRIGTGNKLMCSELSAKFLVGCGFDDFNPYLGKTQDDIHDMCKNYKYWNKIFEC